MLWIGLLAATLDITENLVFNLFRGITPWKVFQYIASGLIGTQAFALGGCQSGLVWRCISRLRSRGLRYFLAPLQKSYCSHGARFFRVWYIAS